MSPRTVLVGDIGGTHTRLALYDARGKEQLAEIVRPSRGYATFEEIALGFLAERRLPHPSVAVFGVAAPLERGAARFTNLSWEFEQRGLARKLATPLELLLNDLAAASRGCL